MKKLLAILIVLVMVFSVFACSGTSDTSGSSPSGSSPSASTSPSGSGETVDMGAGGGAAAEKSGEASPYPNANADGTINLDTIGHYDVNYDYSQNERYKFTYIAQSGGPLYTMSADAYAHWAPLFNMEWMGFQSSNSDTVLYMDMLQQSLDQGVKAFVLDPDNTTFPAVADLMNNYPDAAWMSQMSGPRDGATGEGIYPGGNLINNYVGFDNYDAGVQVTKKVIEWKEETYPDVAWEDVGFIMMEYSTSSQLHERVEGSRDLWLETTGSLDNFFVADCAATGNLNFQAGLDTAGPIITTNTDYKYWLSNGLIDDFAQSVASLIDQQGLTDNSCVAAFGGSGWITQTDAGQRDAFRFALFTAQNLYAEPITGGVYAYLQGWATPDSIWPSWLKWDDKGTDGHTYSNLRLPTVWLSIDDYQHYLAWTDMYAGANAYPTYPRDGIKMDDYSPFVTEVPANFKQP